MICICGHSQTEHVNGGYGICIADTPTPCYCERFERSDDEEGDVDLKYYGEGTN